MPCIDLLANPATQGKGLPIVAMVDKPGVVKEWWKEIDKAGVDIAISKGRWTVGIPSLPMDNERLPKLQKKYPARFLGLAMLSLDAPKEESVCRLDAGADAATARPRQQALSRYTRNPPCTNNHVRALIGANQQDLIRWKRPN